MSLQHDYELTRSYLESGAVCGGTECSGWHLSDFDTFHQCPCGEGRHYDPYDQIAIPPDDRRPLWAVVARDGSGLSWKSVYRNACARAKSLAVERSECVDIVRIDDADTFYSYFPREHPDWRETPVVEPDYDEDAWAENAAEDAALRGASSWEPGDF
jgi:hypothetical protein